MGGWHPAPLETCPAVIQYFFPPEMPLLCLHPSKRQRTALLKHKLQFALTLHFVTLSFETGKFSVNFIKNKRGISNF